MFYMHLQEKSTTGYTRVQSLVAPVLPLSTMQALFSIIWLGSWKRIVTHSTAHSPLSCKVSHHYYLYHLSKSDLSA